MPVYWMDIWCCVWCLYFASVIHRWQHDGEGIEWGSSSQEIHRVACIVFTAQLLSAHQLQNSPWYSALNLWVYFSLSPFQRVCFHCVNWLRLNFTPFNTATLSYFDPETLDSVTVWIYGYLQSYRPLSQFIPHVTWYLWYLAAYANNPIVTKWEACRGDNISVWIDLPPLVFTIH